MDLVPYPVPVRKPDRLYSIGLLYIHTCPGALQGVPGTGTCTVQVSHRHFASWARDWRRCWSTYADFTVVDCPRPVRIRRRPSTRVRVPPAAFTSTRALERVQRFSGRNGHRGYLGDQPDEDPSAAGEAPLAQQLPSRTRSCLAQHAAHSGILQCAAATGSGFAADALSYGHRSWRRSSSIAFPGGGHIGPCELRPWGPWTFWAAPGPACS